MRYILQLGMAAGLAMAVTGAPLGAQQAGTQPAKASAGANSGSANQRAADLLNTVNQGEINTGQLMQNHGQSQPVKDFAGMLVTDHQAAQQQLQTGASQSNINLKDDPGLKKQAQAEDTKLKNDSGSQADKAFVASEVRDHAMAIRRLKALEPKVTDPQLKSAIDSSLATMQKHLDAARKLQSQGH